MEVLNHYLKTYLRCFASEEPHLSSNFLTLVEFLYNSSYHSSIATSPFQAFYGRTPPSIADYSAGFTKIDSLDAALMTREHDLARLKSNLTRESLRMVQMANAHQEDKTFAKGGLRICKITAVPSQISTRRSFS